MAHIYDQFDAINDSQTIKELPPNEIDALRKAAQEQLIAALDPKLLGQYRDLRAKEAARRLIAQVVEQKHPRLIGPVKRGLVNRLVDELHGYGPLDRFLDDPEVTEILVLGWDRIDIEKDGKLLATDAKFRDEQHLRQVIERIVIPTGRRIDESSPQVDARLPDGSRVHARIPPLAVEGSTVAVRKFKKGVTLDRLVEWGALPPKLAEWLAGCMKMRINILVSGGTGSGKTTFLGALVRYIPEDYLIDIVEDPPEIDIDRRRVRRYQTKPPGLEGTGEISLYSVVVGSLRQRPNIIIVGECRSKEAFSMLQAMNTGHAGSITTVHANSAEDAMARLVAMAASSGELPKDQVSDFVARALEMVIHVSRVADGSRKLVEVAQVERETENGRVKTRPLVKLEMSGGRAVWRTVGQWDRETFMAWEGMMPAPLPEGVIGTWPE